MSEAAPRLTLVSEAGLQDVRIGEARRRELKAIVELTRTFCTAEELMYLAGAFERAAYEERTRERAR